MQLEPLKEKINWGHATYMLGKLSEAVYTLAVSEGDVRSRLSEAAVFIFQVAPGMLPVTSGIRADVEWVHREMTRFKPDIDRRTLPPEAQKRADVAYQVTMARIKNKTGSRIAKRLFDAQLKLGSLVHFYAPIPGRARHD